MGVALIATLQACALPARRYSTRAIDDPISPTEGMVDVEVNAGKTFRQEPAQDGRGFYDLTGFLYGFSDRLSYAFPLSLGYAISEQQPLDDRTPARASLLVSGGLAGFGRDWRGWILVPTLGLFAKRRISQRFWVAGSARGAFTLRPESNPRRPWDRRSLNVRVGWQLSDYLALSLGPFLWHEFEATAERNLRSGVVLRNITQTWTHLGAALALELRPWWWVSLHAWMFASQVWSTHASDRPPSPDAPVMAPASDYLQLTALLGLRLRF